MLSFGIDTGPQSFCHSFVALADNIMLFEVSAEKYAVQMCQVVTVVMETVQLVLSQFKNFYCSCSQLRIE